MISYKRQRLLVAEPSELMIMKGITINRSKSERLAKIESCLAETQPFFVKKLLDSVARCPASLSGQSTITGSISPRLFEIFFK